MCFSTIAHTDNESRKTWRTRFTGVLHFTKDNPSESVLACCLLTLVNHHFIAALEKWRLLVGSVRPSWPIQVHLSDGRCGSGSNSVLECVVAEDAGLYSKALHLSPDVPTLTCGPELRTDWKNEIRDVSRQGRVSEEGSAVEREIVEVGCMRPASQGGSSVSWMAPVRRLPLERWNVTLTDIEFIGGDIFISPPLGKPAYLQGRAGQCHPWGKRTSRFQKGGGNQP